MRRTALFVSLVLALLATPLDAEAQQAGRVYRIGLLVTGPREQVSHLVRELEEGLRELGYVEGRNLAIEHRFAEGKLERLSELAAELARLKVDVIVATNNPTALAVKQAATTVPIVMTLTSDPVGAGLIASLARPGGNITGLTLDVGFEYGVSVCSP